MYIHDICVIWKFNLIVLPSIHTEIPNFIEVGLIKHFSINEILANGKINKWSCNNVLDSKKNAYLAGKSFGKIVRILPIL